MSGDGWECCSILFGLIYEAWIFVLGFSSLILTKREKMRLYLIHCFIYQFSIDKGILSFDFPILLFSDLSKIFSFHSYSFMNHKKILNSSKR